MYITTNALVLRTVPVGEADKSILILAEGEGLIWCWARGAGKIKSPLLHASSVFSYGSYTLNKKDDKYTVKQADITESFFDLRKDISALGAAGYVVELCSSLAVEGQDDDNLLRLTLNALFALSRAITSIDSIIAAYTLRALAEAGYLPHLTDCIKCGNNSQNYSFSPLDGGLVCTACAPYATKLPTAVINAMEYVTCCNPKQLYMFKLSEGLPLVFADITADYAVNQLARKFDTFNFYKSVANRKD